MAVQSRNEESILSVKLTQSLQNDYHTVAYPGEVLGGLSTPFFQLIVFANIRLDNVLISIHEIKRIFVT